MSPAKLLETHNVTLPAYRTAPAVCPTVLSFAAALTMAITVTAGCASAPEVLGPLRAETVVALRLH